MIVTGLLAYIETQSAVTNIVGQNIQPVPAPEDPTNEFYPCITYQVPSDVSEYGLQGETGLIRTRVIYQCWALRYLDARNLAVALKGALSGYSGTLSTGEYVDQIQIVNMIDEFHSEARIYNTAVHALVYYNESN